ncbi:hypothetical protein KY330_05140 [Candidatus Woesearchaeota archaeon]|nr:hypothetical protein [Candidatus Woesearchaeota archaeon]
MKKRELSLFLFILGVFILVFSQRTITGGFIGYVESEVLFGTIGLVLIVTGLLVLANGEEDDKESKLIGILRKTKKGVIFSDPNWTIAQDLGHPVTDKPADVVLDELESVAKDPDIKEILQDGYKESGYIDSAYRQRDENKEITELKPQSIEWYADRFVKAFDKNYKPWLKPLLRMPDEEEMKELESIGAGPYDTRDALPLIEDNVEGFIIDDKTIGTHDVHVTYRGARFQVFAGSQTPYETSKAQIDQVINRMVEEDAKAGRITDKEKAKRRDVIRKRIYGD